MGSAIKAVTGSDSESDRQRRIFLDARTPDYTRKIFSIFLKLANHDSNEDNTK